LSEGLGSAGDAGMAYASYTAEQMLPRRASQRGKAGRGARRLALLDPSTEPVGATGEKLCAQKSFVSSECWQAAAERKTGLHKR
jgi:hypothetical protein